MPCEALSTICELCCQRWRAIPRRVVDGAPGHVHMVCHGAASSEQAGASHALTNAAQTPANAGLDLDKQLANFGGSRR